MTGTAGKLYVEGTLSQSAITVVFRDLSAELRADIPMSVLHFVGEAGRSPILDFVSEILDDLIIKWSFMNAIIAVAQTNSWEIFSSLCRDIRKNSC